MKFVDDAEAPASAASSCTVAVLVVVHKGDFGSLMGGRGFFSRKTVKQTSCLRRKKLVYEVFHPLLMTN